MAATGNESVSLSQLKEYMDNKLCPVNCISVRRICTKNRSEQINWRRRRAQQHAAIPRGLRLEENGITRYKTQQNKNKKHGD